MNSQEAGRVACFRDQFETFQGWVPSYRKEAEPYLDTLPVGASGACLLQISIHILPSVVF
jgi:hypothetical protein